MGRGGRGLQTKTAQTSLNTRTVSTKIFRSGTTEKVADYGVAQEYFEAADSCVPEGRVGRLQGLFCGSDLEDLGQWTRSNLNAGSEYSVDPQEFHYRGPEPYVYPANAWLAASCDYDAARRLRESMSPEEIAQSNKEIFEREYWSQGIPLSQYRENIDELKKEHIWRGGGEILADPQYISSTRKVSMKRLLGAVSPSDASEIKRAFRMLR